jgi:hypothetical protein
LQPWQPVEQREGEGHRLMIVRMQDDGHGTFRV